MESRIKELLKNVPRSYQDFVAGVWGEIEDNEEHQKKLIEYLENNPDAQSDEVLDYIDNEILKIEIVFEE